MGTQQGLAKRAALLGAAALTVGAPASGSSAAGGETTVRFSFDARATTGLLVSGSGTLTLRDTPARGIFQQAEALRSVVTIRRGGPSARLAVLPAGASYVFLTTIGVRIQEVRLNGRITKSTIPACRVGSPGAIVVEAEQNLPSLRTPSGVESFADDAVVFRLCGVRDADPAARTTISGP
jgi:hypothetical protein